MALVLNEQQRLDAQQLRFKVIGDYLTESTTQKEKPEEKRGAVHLRELAAQVAMLDSALIGADSAA